MGFNMEYITKEWGRTNIMIKPLNCADKMVIKRLIVARTMVQKNLPSTEKLNNQFNTIRRKNPNEAIEYLVNFTEQRLFQQEVRKFKMACLNHLK